MTDIITLGQPTVGADELDAIEAVFDSGWLAGNGPTSHRFEEAFAVTAGARHALAVSNCTAALHLAFRALQLSAGDEVIIADYTFPATGHAALFTGARPVFVDVRPDIWTLDPAQVEAAISPRTVGIVAVDVFGQTADYDELRTIATKHGLWLVEDAAAASGATYRGRPAGSLADAGCFSFHGRKGITAGEGGALTTDLPELDAAARSMHAFGVDSALDRAASSDLPVPTFVQLGYNYKLSDVAAAIMLVQLRRLPDLIAKRRWIADQYAQRLGNLELVSVPAIAPERDHVWQSYVLTLDPVLDRGLVAKQLRAHGVQCSFGTYASHIQPVYGSTRRCPISADLFARHLAIPMHANLSSDDIDSVCDTVTSAVVAGSASR